MAGGGMAVGTGPSRDLRSERGVGSQDFIGLPDQLGYHRYRRSTDDHLQPGTLSLGRLDQPSSEIDGQAGWQNRMTVAVSLADGWVEIRYGLGGPARRRRISAVYADRPHLRQQQRLRSIG